MAPNPNEWIDPWGLKYWRGARPGQAPSFEPRDPLPGKKDSGDYRVCDLGKVKATHGLSVFSNPESVSSKGFVPHEMDMDTLPNSLRVIQRGNDAKHYEIVPSSPMTPEQYKAALSQIKTKSICE